MAPGRVLPERLARRLDSDFPAPQTAVLLAVADAMLVGLGMLARRFGPKRGNIDREKRFEAMPDNSPPKWMFRNITAIRENTDRILELLESGRAEPVRQPRRHHLITDTASGRDRPGR